VGGGFVVDHAGAPADGSTPADQVSVPYPFNSADELLKHSAEHGMSISGLMLENEKALISEPEVRRRVIAIWRRWRRASGAAASIFPVDSRSSAEPASIALRRSTRRRIRS
jgi:hypothetical protein